MYRNISTNGLYSDILTIKYVDPVPENIKTNIDGTSKIVDDAATLTLDIKDNNYKYQWLLNGETIAGATSNTYHIENVKMKDAGSYTCRVRNECTETVSTPVTLTVSKCQQTIDFPEFETVTHFDKHVCCHRKRKRCNSFSTWRNEHHRLAIRQRRLY